MMAPCALSAILGELDVTAPADITEEEQYELRTALLRIEIRLTAAIIRDSITILPRHRESSRHYGDLNV